MYKWSVAALFAVLAAVILPPLACDEPEEPPPPPPGEFDRVVLGELFSDSG